MLKRLEVQTFQGYGIPTQPGRQKRYNVSKSHEESAVFKMCKIDLSYLSLELEKLARLQKISLDFTSERKQVNASAFLFCTNTCHFE